MPAKTLKLDDVMAEWGKDPRFVAEFERQAPHYRQVRTQLTRNTIQGRSRAPIPAPDSWDALWAEVLPLLIVAAVAVIAGTLLAHLVWMVLR